ncbi:unnamed protein product [Phytophthora lilii]|uniref:Unnamed protein product n=1 Tax=Phytophthora lilii TaxID=2077276 RepID=A0A9W6TAJ7_9STRA|nr:unnamed protein product [Phytophthora lilii]
MFAYELERLKILNIQAIKCGSSYRVKVRGRTGKMVYVSNVSRPTNQKLLAKQYKISVKTLKKHMSPDYKTDPKYRFYNGKHMESHLYVGIQPAEFYDKLENVLATQTNAFKVSIALGYDLISLTDGDFTQYWHSNLANSYVFKTPVAINSRSDIRWTAGPGTSINGIDHCQTGYFLGEHCAHSAMSTPQPTSSTAAATERTISVAKYHALQGVKRGVDTGTCKPKHVLEGSRVVSGDGGNDMPLDFESDAPEEGEAEEEEKASPSQHKDSQSLSRKTPEPQSESRRSREDGPDASR